MPCHRGGGIVGGMDPMQERSALLRQRARIVGARHELSERRYNLLMVSMSLVRTCEATCTRAKELLDRLQQLRTQNRRLRGYYGRSRSPR